MIWVIALKYSSEKHTTLSFWSQFTGQELPDWINSVVSLCHPLFLFNCLFSKFCFHKLSVTSTTDTKKLLAQSFTTNNLIHFRGSRLAMFEACRKYSHVVKCSCSSHEKEDIKKGENKLWEILYPGYHWI